MPELPDVSIYVEALARHMVGQVLERVRLASPFLLRSVDPPLSEVQGKRVIAIERLGKRIVIGVEEELFLVLHLMIAGRLHRKEPGARLAGRRDLAAFDYAAGTLTLTEAGTKKRASLFLLLGRDALAAHDRGGIDPLACTPAEFRSRLLAESHTLKRALCDPRAFSGIGNAYSDEILHRARLSPLALTQRLGEAEIERLFGATRETLTLWIERLRAACGGGFPEGVTAFREGMAVHGRFGKPCPVCGLPVQRIVYADNETNYCARCQTGGRLLADRALSRLLKDDWPRSIEELAQE
jgi:formamidopyrimidine-DNA glycosylase